MKKLLVCVAACVLAVAGLVPPAGAVSAPPAGPVFKGATTNARLGITFLPGARPPGTVPGDVLLTVVTANRPHASEITPPSGWRRECSWWHEGSPSIVVAAFTKVAIASDPTSWDWYFPADTGATVAVSAYGGVDPGVRTESCVGVKVFGSASITAPAIETATANSRVVAAYGFRGAGTSTPPSGPTERFDVATASDAARSVSSSLVDGFRASVGNVPAATATASLTPAAAVALRFALRPAPGTPLFTDPFSQPNGLVTNGWAKWNSTSPAAVTSPDWIVTSGSMFAYNGRAWTGQPDRISPNATSSNGTGSGVLRVITRRADFENARVSFSLWNWGLVNTAATDRDGAHVFLRYKSETSAYYASLNRRDNTVIIKKKVPGGPSNGGTYYPLSPSVSHPVPYGQQQSIEATVQTLDNGSVQITLSAGGQLLVQGIDDGSKGGPPIYGAGHAGIRGDNANLEFDDFSIVHLG